MGRWGVWVAIALVAGCFGGRKTSLSTSVSVSQSSVQDVSSLRRQDYEVLDAVQGQITSQSYFLLWFPVGVQKTKADLVEDAYYKASDTNTDCDGLLLPHTTTKTVVVPLILVNVVSRQVTLRGRCIHLLNNAQLSAGAAAAAPTTAP